jgi:O-antigen/teichoic acid export membrane protein
MTAEVARIPNARRTRVVLHESALGLVYRLGGMAASFAAMPVMLAQLGSHQLGAWLVLLSGFQWITFFDLGVAAGARNEIARAVAHQDLSWTKRAISTGWYYTVIITAALALGITVLLGALPVSQWLQHAAFGGIDAGGALWVVGLGACLSFALNYVQTVYAAHERASAISLFGLLCSTGFLVLLLLIPRSEGAGITRMSWMYLAALIAANGWLIVRFFRQHPSLLPTTAAVDRKLRSRIMAFGTRLFVVQLAAMLMFTTARLMVSMFVGPAEVVVYDAAAKVFSIITMGHGLLMTTLWSSFTHAHEHADWAWIRQMMRRLIVLMVLVAGACTLVAALSPWLINMWLGPSQVGSAGMYAWFALAVVLSCWSNIFAYYLNGIGDVNVQLYSAIAAALLNVPASYFLAVMMQMGTSGVLAGTVCSSAVFAVIGPWRVMRLLQKCTTE